MMFRVCTMSLVLMAANVPYKVRRHSTYEPAQPAETAQWAVFAGKMRAKLQPSDQRAGRVESTQVLFAEISTNPGFELGRDLLPSSFEALQAHSQVGNIMHCKR
jgi:hypothetical protein